MTTTDIIKALSMDEKVRTQLLNLYPFMEPAEKFEVSKIAWQTYMAIYNERVNENLELQFEEVKEGTGELGDDFYARALKKTEQEMEDIMREGHEKYDLSAARIAMKKIVDEISATKKHHAKKAK